MGINKSKLRINVGNTGNIENTAIIKCRLNLPNTWIFGEWMGIR